MAADDIQQEDRTEEATPERREDFRERGQIAVSRELTSVLVLAATVIVYTVAAPGFVGGLRSLFARHFDKISTPGFTQAGFLRYAASRCGYLNAKLMRAVHTCVCSYVFIRRACVAANNFAIENKVHACDGFV